MSVLGSYSFNVALWILLTVGLIGNASVILWRCTRPREQRGSVISLMIILLAVSDFLYCLHLLIVEGSVADEIFGDNKPSRSGLQWRYYATSVESCRCCLPLLACG